MKYISVDALQAFCDNQIDHSITPNDFQRMNHIEIVRCKDCKFAHMTYDGLCKYCDKYTDDDGFQIELYQSGDWFCADGIPKEGGGHEES